MKHILVIIIIFPLFLVACSKSKELSKTQIKSDTELKFPGDWLGYWEGDLKIYNALGLTQTIPMAVDHQLTDTIGLYKWAIIYGEDTIAGRRDYFLRAIDAAKGFYEIDERNSILLRSFVINDKLISTYNVGDVLISSVYTLRNNVMTFEIFAGKTDRVLTSGDTLYNGEKIPKVDSYLSTGYQVATLHKKTLSN